MLCGVGEFGEGVAFVVEVDVGEAELVEAVEDPGGSGGLAEGWGGDADEVELPLAELGLVEMEPVEGAVDGGEGGEAGDAPLRGRGGGGGGGGHQDSTSAGNEYQVRKTGWVNLYIPTLRKVREGWGTRGMVVG